MSAGPSAQSRCDLNRERAVRFYEVRSRSPRSLVLVAATLLVAAFSVAGTRVSAQPGMSEERCSSNVYPTCLSAATSAFAYGDSAAALRSVVLEADNTALNGRMPVLFIHGFANSGIPAAPDWMAFDNMLVYLKDHGGLQRFKPYRVTWYSNRTCSVRCGDATGPALEQLQLDHGGRRLDNGSALLSPSVRAQHVA